MRGGDPGVERMQEFVLHGLSPVPGFTRSDSQLANVSKAQEPITGKPSQVAISVSRGAFCWYFFRGPRWLGQPATTAYLPKISPKVLHSFALKRDDTSLVRSCHMSLMDRNVEPAHSPDISPRCR